MGYPIIYNPMPVTIRAIRGSLPADQGQVILDPDFQAPMGGAKKFDESGATDLSLEAQVSYVEADKKDKTSLGDTQRTAGHLIFTVDFLTAQNLTVNLGEEEMVFGTGVTGKIGKGSLIMKIAQRPCRYKITAAESFGHLRGQSHLMRMPFMKDTDERT